MRPWGGGWGPRWGGEGAPIVQQEGSALLSSVWHCDSGGVGGVGPQYPTAAEAHGTVQRKLCVVHVLAPTHADSITFCWPSALLGRVFLASWPAPGSRPQTLPPALLTPPAGTFGSPPTASWHAYTPPPWSLSPPSGGPAPPAAAASRCAVTTASRRPRSAALVSPGGSVENRLLPLAVLRLPHPDVRGKGEAQGFGIGLWGRQAAWLAHTALGGQWGGSKHG